MTNGTKKPNILPIIVALLGAIGFILLLVFLTKDMDIALLNPKGLIANEQHKLLIASTSAMLVFGVPVILTMYFFIWRFRDKGQPNSQVPETSSNKAILTFAWGAPFIVVAIIASMMLPATQRLEPQKSIESDKDQLTVQVVALDWKWLFIYPEQEIATINFTQIPVDTPVRFELTSDKAPMNSFWIPHLGGMLYSMTGHVNPLNLMGDTIGDYPGGAAEVNGRGLAGMRFTARVSSEEDFAKWVDEVKRTSPPLSQSEYDKLLEPSENHQPTYYSNPVPNLYNTIVSKYNSGHMHMHGSNHEEHGSH